MLSPGLLRAHLPPAAPPVTRRSFGVGGAVLPLLLASPPASAAEEITRRAYLDIAIDGEPAGRIVVGLNAEPGAARFAALVKGEAGASYRRKAFTKVLPGYVEHGGVAGYAGGGEELAGKAGEGLAEGTVGLLVGGGEKKKRLVAKKGRLEMVEEAEGGRNGTEFVIVVKDGGLAEGEEGEVVVVGRVVEGREVAERIAAAETVKENSSSPYFR
ncbi:cyclophilin-like peptidyl-prolyl cis-trans isomerase family protein isoform X2 [Wolffia australiana]